MENLVLYGGERKGMALDRAKIKRAILYAKRAVGIKSIGNY